MAVLAPLITCRQRYRPEPRKTDCSRHLRSALVRHRSARPRHLRSHRLGLAHHALYRRHGRHHRRAAGPTDRHHRRLCRRCGRCGSDAHHRHLPGLSPADTCLGLRFSTRPRHRERGAGDRTHHLVALCPHRPRRGADLAQQRVHPGGQDAGGLVRPHPRSPCRALVPVLGHRPPDARHGRHHPHRRRPRLPRPRRPAALAGMGGDDLDRPPVHPRSVVGADHSRASQSSSSRSASTCSATACATCSIREAARDDGRQVHCSRSRISMSPTAPPRASSKPCAASASASAARSWALSARAAPASRRPAAPSCA